MAVAYSQFHYIRLRSVCQQLVLVFDHNLAQLVSKQSRVKISEAKLLKLAPFCAKLKINE